MKNGGLSNKKQKAPEVAIERQTYPAFLEKMGQKTDLFCLATGMLASGGDLITLVADMRAANYSEGVAEADFERLLFSPQTTDIRRLPAAILDAKEALPPFDLMPATKNELGTYLRRLMVATEKDANIDVLVAGWSTGRSPGHDFNSHIDQLWQLRSEDPYLYTALVTGRFGSVIRNLGQIEQTSKQKKRIRDLLLAQSLIWCAHDVQLIFARLDKAPFYGHLLPPGRSAEGTLNDLRDQRAALSVALDLYDHSPDWREKDIDPNGVDTQKPLSAHANPTLRRLAKRARPLEKQLVEYAAQIPLTEMMRQIKSLVRTDPFMKRVESPRTQNIEAKSYAANWYGLPELAAASVPILRLIQAEQQLPAMIDDVINGRAFPAMSILNPLPAHASVKLRHRSATRVEELLDYYRSAVLTGQNRNNNRAWKAIREGSGFLRERGTRQLGDHHGPAGDPRRAFYLLDVIPEHRFAVTCAFIGEK